MLTAIVWLRLGRCCGKCDAVCFRKLQWSILRMQQVAKCKQRAAAFIQSEPVRIIDKNRTFYGFSLAFNSTKANAEL